MALGDGTSWNESLPDNTTVANQIDDYDRDLRVGVRSRMAIEHIWPSSQTATGQAGMHSFITLQKSTAKPTLVAASGQVAGFYITSSGTGYNCMIENSAGTEIVLLNELNKIPAATVSTLSPLAGAVVQVVNTMVASVATCSTTLPEDDTIPQKTEGDEVMTLAITPTSATNKLLIEIVAQVTLSGTNARGLIALFQDTTANALAAGVATGGSTGGNLIPSTSIKLTHYMTAGTTSETTFKVRIGTSSGTAYFNGDSSGNRLFGGVAASSITITEIQV